MARRKKENGVSIASAFKARKGKLSGGLIALSSAVILTVYAIGRESSTAASDPLMVEVPTAVASIAQSPPPPFATSTNGGPSTATSATTYKDGTYTGSGNSRHGGMQVTVVISGGTITSANVVSCHTRYSCSDVDGLVREAISMQGVPAKHVSGATDSSDAYKRALAAALDQALAS